MKKSYSVHEFFVREGDKPAILISEEENAKIEIDLPEFHIELSLPEDVLREFGEKIMGFFLKKVEKAQERAEKEET